jgi:TRIAD3 protein (E3 ubiquitin-protein ligase RNF216)
VPVRHITSTLKQQNTLYKAYGVIETQIANYERITKTYTRISKPRIKRGIELQLIEQGSQLPKELHAAKKKSEVEAGKSSVSW